MMFSAKALEASIKGSRESYNEGDDVELRCETSATSDYTVTWFKDGIKIQQDENSISSANTNPGNLPLCFSMSSANTNPGNLPLCFSMSSANTNPGNLPLCFSISSANTNPGNLPLCFSMSSANTNPGNWPLCFSISSANTNPGNWPLFFKSTVEPLLSEFSIIQPQVHSPNSI